MPELVRRPHIMAGLFYPETAADARRAIERYMGAAAAGDDAAIPLAAKSDAAGEAPVAAAAGKPSRIAALIVPHAAWELSGKAVGAAVRSAARGFGNRAPERIVVIGPTHQGGAPGLYLCESDSFETVLGDIPVDSAFTAEFESCGTSFLFNDIPHLEEHSIEIVLPFLKYAFPKTPIVPILLSGARPSDVSALARALDFLVGPDPDDTLVVVSANLATRGCSCRDAAGDRDIEDLVQTRNANGLLALAAGTPPLCGGAACAALFLSRMSEDWTIAIAAREEASLQGLEDIEGEVRSCYRSFVCGAGQ